MMSMFFTTMFALVGASVCNNISQAPVRSGRYFNDYNLNMDTVMDNYIDREYPTYSSYLAPTPSGSYLPPPPVVTPAPATTPTYEGEPLKRTLTGFLEGAKFTGLNTLSLPLPVCNMLDLCSTLDLTIPINLKLPSPAAKRSSLRRVEDDHATVYQMAENLMTNFGLDGKACVLRAICELAESRGLKHDGLVGKTLETLLLLDYSMSSTDSLYEYIAARTYGEHHGNCDTAYPQCPYSAFQILDNIESLQNLV